MGKTIGCINVCNILFDEKFKVFIKKMKDKFIEELEGSKTCFDYRILADTQKIYRNYIIHHKQELTFIKNDTLINQEYFAIIVSLIYPNIDNINKFEDIFQYYKKEFSVFANDLADVDDKRKITYTHCACCHSVQTINTFYLRNLSTGYTLLIGCDCILKHKILSFEELEKLKNERKFKQRTAENHCLFCGRNKKCKGCINKKIAIDIFKNWKSLLENWKYQKRLLPSNILYFQRKRIKRLLKPLGRKWKQSLIQKQQVAIFQRKRLLRLLKVCIKIWRKKHPRKCLKCKTTLKGDLYNVCYSCYIEEKDKCEDCGKLISKEYTKCYDCKYKYSCQNCNIKMINDKYKYCFKCNKK